MDASAAVRPPWLPVAAAGAVLLACDIPLEVSGYPVGAGVRALAGVAVALGLIAARPKAPPPLRGARRRIVGAACLVALAAAFLLAGTLVPRGAALAAPVAAGALTLACFFGCTGFARVAHHQAWSFAARAWDRAALGTTAVCLLLFLAAFAVMLVHLVIGEADPPSHPGLVVAVALGRALIAGSVVAGLAWSARDRADLGGQPRGLLARLAPAAGRIAFVVALAPPLALEAARTLHHLRRPSWTALVDGPPSRFRVPGPPGTVLERWGDLGWSTGRPRPVEAPAEDFGLDEVTRRHRLRVELAHGDAPLMRLDLALLATFARQSDELLGARVQVTELAGSRGLRAVVHTWIDLDAAPPADGQRALPFVVQVALVRGHGFEVGGARVRGLTPEVIAELYPPLPELAPVPSPPAWSLPPYDVLLAPRPAPDAELRYLVRLEGALRARAGEGLPTVRFAASHEDRSYRLTVEQEGVQRDAGLLRHARATSRSRSYRWRGRAW